MAGKVQPIRAEAASIRLALSRILASSEFANSERMCRFLRFVVEEKLAGRSDALKETLIGVHVFDRDPGYDPKNDAIVRVEARRLRSKLLEYAQAHPTTEGVVIELPKGGYEPEFCWRTPAAPAGSRETAKQRSVRPLLLWIALGCAVAVLVVAGRKAWVYSRRPLYAALESKPFTTYPGYETGPSFSPDGQNIAFCWGGPVGGPEAVWIQSVSSDTPLRLTHSSDTEARPVWSPDGKQIAFLRRIGPSHRAIYLINTSGTGERKVGEMTDRLSVGRIEWSPDGQSLITSDIKDAPDHSVIVLLSLKTGEKQQVTALSGRIRGDAEPTFSPDGRFIAFRRSTGVSVEDLYAAPVPSNGIRLPLAEASLRRITFDNRGLYGFAWCSDSRSLVVASSRAGSTHSLWRFSLSGGEPSRLTEAGMDAILPAISRAGNRLAYVRDMTDINIWEMLLLPASPPKPLIASTMLDSSPQFSPDGTRIAFRSNRSGSDEIWLANAGGTDQHQLTHFNGPLTGSPRWSPDGNYIAFDSREAGNSNIYLISAAGGTPRRLTTGSSNNVLPSWSRDGKFIYFASDRSSVWQVWSQNVVGGEAQQLTKNGGFSPLESPDGQSLFYYRRDPEPAIWRIPVRGGGQESYVTAIHWDEMWGNWAVGSHGLYFLNYHPAPNTPTADIDFLDFRSGQIQQLGKTPRKPTPWNTGLAVSPDERRILFSQADREGSDIMLAENFR